MKSARIASVLLLFGVLGLGAVWVAGSIMARPNNAVLPPPQTPGRLVALTSADGTALQAAYWPGAGGEAPAILLLHGVDASRAMFRDHAAWLHRLGYAVLALDFRGHGGSGATERTFGWREADDAAAALAWLKESQPTRKVGAIGVSLGGAAALLGQKGPLPVDALVLQGVYPDIRTAIANRLNRAAGPFIAAISEPLLSYQSYMRYGVPPERIAPVEGLRRFRAPVLVIGGTADSSTTPADSHSLFAAAQGPKSLWMVETDHRGVSTLDNPEYRRRIAHFFGNALRSGT